MRRYRLISLMLILVPHGILAENAQAQESLSPDGLRQSLQLGTEFLLNNQRSSGNFEYLYDWKRQRHLDEDSQVRQAGAVWGLALIHAYRPSDDVNKALRKALDFMNASSRGADEGWRFIVYPGDKLGSTGTVALVALAHLEYLAGLDAKDERYQRYRRMAEEYLQFLLQLRDAEGHWHSRYDLLTGRGFAAPSPYFDGEAMLALCKAAKYHGLDELAPLVVESAHAGYRRYVTQAREQEPDSALTKGYYQWASMTYFELATSGWADSEVFGDRLLELADWMIDVHKTLDRTRNTAYAYEGIIPAYQLAKQRHDLERARKLRKVIVQGLNKLTSWQIGHSSANAYVRGAPRDDRRARGGIQNHRREPLLRVDVVQHQMHAVMLALRYCVE